MSGDRDNDIDPTAATVTLVTPPSSGTFGTHYDSATRAAGTDSGVLSDEVVVQELLGRGGEADVLLAEQVSLQRTIAVKRPRGASNDILREARIIAQLDHPNIVPIYDVRMIDQQPSVLMKKVEGDPWSRVFKDNTLIENLEILSRVCDGVAFAHSRDILHLDLKLSNVMIGDYGQVYVTDWGTALPLDQVNLVEKVVGTPAYMAPEMLSPGGPIMLSRQSDVYLLGAMLYRLTEGAPPHRAKTLEEVFAKARMSEPTFSGKCPKPLELICLRAMSKAPIDRYESVQEFKSDIVTFLQKRDTLGLLESAQGHLEFMKAATLEESIEDHYLRARTLFEQVLTKLPEQKAAQIGLGRLISILVDREIANQNFERALTVAESSTFVCAEVVMCARQKLDEEIERRRDHEALVAEAQMIDRVSAKRSIVSLGFFLLAFAVLPQVARALVTAYPFWMQGAAVIATEAIITITGVWIYRSSAAKNRWVSYVFSSLALITVGGGLAIAAHVAFGLTTTVTILLAVFANTFVIAAFATLFDRRLVLTALIYFVMSVLSLRMTGSLSTFFAAARDATIILSIVLILREAGKRVDRRRRLTPPLLP